ncbi:MAG: T9SS type A sorting domain-containing protein [Candidatus Syntrophosphaera sp.]|nr:T9SS type A sorting domain-containing protein [Candidatus Syntrophosphaera sp.]
MKRLVLLCALLTAACLSWATIGDFYDFNATTQTYTAITGTQVTSVQGDDQLSEPIDIGFDFTYGLQSFSQIMISSNGWVGLGTNFSSSMLGNQLASTQYCPVLAPLWDDLSMGDGNVQTLLSGSTPNRVFTVQYTNARWSYSANNQFSFQVRLHESGKVDMKYGPRNGTPSYAYASIGINMAPGGSGWFYSVTPGNPATASTTTENAQISAFPALNVIYEFTPSALSNNDLAALSITGPSNPHVGSTSTYTVTVQNAGVYSQAIYQVKLITAANVELASVVGTPIQPGQTIVYNLSWIPANPGLLTIHGKVVLPGDEFTDNDQTPPLPLWILPAGTGTVSIGEGDLLELIPLNMYYRNSLWEGIFYPSELGFGQTSVIGISLYNNFLTNLPAKPTKIWLGAATVADLSGGWIPSTQLSLVYDGPVDYPSGENVINIPFTNPYPYFGGNLVMMVNRPMDTVYYSYYDQFYCQTLGDNRALNVYSDGTEFDPADPPAWTFDPGIPLPKITFFFSSGSPADDPSVPALATSLQGNHPNPFNPSTTISFGLKEASVVRIGIYNLKGQLVATLLDGEKAAGNHSLVWNGNDASGRPVSSGVYFCRMEAPEHSSTRKMLMLK